MRSAAVPFLALRDASQPTTVKAAYITTTETTAGVTGNVWAMSGAKSYHARAVSVGWTGRRIQSRPDLAVALIDASTVALIPGAGQGHGTGGQEIRSF